MRKGAKNLEKELNAQLLKEREVIKEFNNTAIRIFEREKKMMLSAFDNHPITREIRGGANGSNLSGTMQGGNLFGFIGFPAGSDPISPLREVLEKTNIRPKMDRQRTAEKIYEVELPEENVLRAATPMPWASGRSWLLGIENGMSGLGRYLDTESPYSRSGGGIQSKHIVKGGSFTGVTYLTNGGILSDFKKRNY